MKYESIYLDKLKLINNFNNYSCLNVFSGISIDICSCCNLACPHCHTQQNDFSSKNKLMPYDTFKFIVNQIPNKLSHIILQGLGEPMLHPDLNRMIAYAKNNNISDYITFCTNLLASDIDNYVRCFTSGLAWMTISLDSLRDDTTQKLRKGTDVDKLIFNIKYLTNITKKLSIQTTVNKLNMIEIDEIANFVICNNISQWNLVREVDVHKNKDSNSYNFGKSNQLTLSMAEIKLVMSKIEKYKNSIPNIVTKYFYTHPQLKKRCIMPWESMFISSQANVVPCCNYLDDSVLSFGDVTKINILDVWYGKQMQDFRNNMYDVKPAICNGCIHY